MRAIALLALIVAVAAPRLEAQADLVGPHTTELGFDRPGSDYETFEQTGEYQMHDLCRDACFSQPRCKAYTFVKPGVRSFTFPVHNNRVTNVYVKQIEELP